MQEQGAGASNLVTGFGYDQFYARTDGSGTQVPLSDSLQSTVGMTDAAGGLGAQYTYEPYGSTTVAGSGGASQQFTGRENDGTGLMYYRARYYAPGMGRFVSEDPLGFGGGDVNLYGYAASSPTIFRDPSGKIIGVGPGLFGAVPLFFAAGTIAAVATAVTTICYQTENFSRPMTDVQVLALLGAMSANFMVSGILASALGIPSVGGVALSAETLLLTSTTFGALGNALEYANGQAVSNQDIQLRPILIAALAGAIGGFLAGLPGFVTAYAMYPVLLETQFRTLSRLLILFEAYTAERIDNHPGFQ